MPPTHDERFGGVKRTAAWSRIYLDAARGAQHTPGSPTLIRRFIMTLSPQDWEIALHEATHAGLERGDNGLERGNNVILPEIDAALAYRIRKTKDLALAASIYNRIPVHSELLQRAGLESARLCVKVALERQRQDVDPVAFTFLQCGLAIRLLQAGRIASGHREASRALRFIRQRYHQNPSGTSSAYLEALEAYATTAEALGKHRLSLQTRRDAIQLLRQQPEARRRLAQSLSNFARDLDSVGDSEGALTASRDAVSLYRTIVEQQSHVPQSHVPQTADPTGLNANEADASWDFAAALVGLGNRLIDGGQKDEAYAVVKESVTVAERLHGKAPEEATALAAMAHFDLGRTLSKVGRNPEARQEMEQADQMFSTLYAISPLRHALEYGVVLRGLAFVAMELGDYATAATYSHRQIDVYKSRALRGVLGIEALALNAVSELYIFQDAQGEEAERSATLEQLHCMAREYGLLVQQDKTEPEWVIRPTADLKDYTRDLIAEFVKVRTVPGIEFRTAGNDRIAWVSGADEVWRIVKGVREQERERWTEAQVATALAYHQTYPAEIDGLIARQR